MSDLQPNLRRCILYANRSVGHSSESLIWQNLFTCLLINVTHSIRFITARKTYVHYVSTLKSYTI